MPQVVIRGEDCNGTPIPEKTATIPSNPTQAQIKAALDDVTEQVADALDRAGCTTKGTAYHNAIT